MNDVVERATSLVFCAVAVALVAILAHREFRPLAKPTTTPLTTTEFVPEWQEILPASRRMGSSDAAVTIVEFSDLECPFCRRFHAALKSAMSEDSTDIAVAFVHYPLTQHRFARPAARALECAIAQGRTRAMLDVLFDGHDSLGLKPWTSFARDAGVGDTLAFNRCARATEQMAIVDAGVSMGARFHVTATPTVLINGWRYNVPPTEAILVTDIKAIRAGRPPASAVSARD
jgi:protein-disulfide isomerase